MKKVYLSSTLLFLTAPVFVGAYFDGVNGWVLGIIDIIGWLIPVAFALCLLAFFWGVALFIFHAGGSENNLDSGRSIMIAGIVGLFVVSAIWGIVGFIATDLLGDANWSADEAKTVPSVDLGT